MNGRPRGVKQMIQEKSERPRACVCVVCVVIPFIVDVRFVDLYLPAGLHRRNVTQDFSTVLLRCLPSFFSREGFSRSFPSSTAKSTVTVLCTTNELIVVHLLAFFFFFCEEKTKSYDDTGIRTNFPNVRRFRGYQLNHRGDRQ